MTKTTPHCAYGNEKTSHQVIDELREHNVWLESELKRYQDAGCATVAERMHAQAKTISRLMTGLHEAIDLLSEVKNGQ